MTKLPFHEWLIISLLIATLFMIAFITLFKSSDSLPVAVEDHTLIAEQTLQVTIKGAVERAGDYQFVKGSTLQDALDVAKPTVEADLSKLKTKMRLRNNQTITVPQECWITVHVEGEVKSAKSLRLKKGIMAKDLIPLLEFNEQADCEKLNKQRRLKDQEMIKVSAKKTVKKQKEILQITDSQLDNESFNS